MAPTAELATLSRLLRMERLPYRPRPEEWPSMGGRQTAPPPPAPADTPTAPPPVEPPPAPDHSGLDRLASMVGFNRWSLPTYPTPDGSLGAQGDRQQMAKVYRGLLAGLPSLSGLSDEAGGTVLDESGQPVLGNP